MSSNEHEMVEEKAFTPCSSCNKILTYPLTYSGRLRCPVCGQFQVIKPVVEEEEVLGIDLYTDRRFWMGLAVPILAPLLTWLALLTEIHQPTSPDIAGLFYFMCSLCLWPIIGFVIATRRGTFVISFRKGARISAIVALAIASLYWLFALSLFSSGITN
ncbi:MAG: hypothetical protein ACPIBN_07335 [Candidatus Poseidoniaceae archaeon]